MKTKSILVLTIAVVIGLGWFLGPLLSCSKGAEEEHEHEAHESAHGGSLNAIEECHVGHVEILLKESTLKCWFVGGDQNTTKALRVPDEEIVLTVDHDPGKNKELILKAKPIELAGEKIGDCSYFEGEADWLKGLLEFEATGTATVKGTKRTITIHYPHGYDPDHEHEGQHHEDQNSKEH